MPRAKTLKRAKPEEIPRAASAGEPVRVKMVDPMEDKGRGGRRQATTAAAPSTVRTAKWLKDRADPQLWFDKVLEASRVGDGGGDDFELPWATQKVVRKRGIPGRHGAVEEMSVEVNDVRGGLRVIGNI